MSVALIQSVFTLVKLGIAKYADIKAAVAARRLALAENEARAQAGEFLSEAEVDARFEAVGLKGDQAGDNAASRIDQDNPPAPDGPDGFRS